MMNVALGSSSVKTRTHQGSGRKNKQNNEKQKANKNNRFPGLTANGVADPQRIVLQSLKSYRSMISGLMKSREFLTLHLSY